MAQIANVVLRGTVYHFRRGVPDQLRQRLQRRELVRSLGTSDIRTAKLAACRLYVASEGLFSALHGVPMLTDDQIAHLVQDFYTLILDDENAGRLARGAFPVGVREMRVSQYAMMADKARDALASNRLDEAHFVTAMMLKRQGISINELPPVQAAQAKQALLRAGVDLSEALKARYEGNFNYEPSDRFLKTRLDAPHPNHWPPRRQDAGADAIPAGTDAAPSTASAPPEPCFSQVAEAFRTSQLETKRWDHQTAAQARATFRLFVEVCGDNPVKNYTRKDAGHFRDLIERLPQDYGKHPRYRSLTVEQILAAYATLAPETRPAPITQKTVKRHFSALSTLWTTAAAKDEADANIFAGFRFANTRKASEQRDMWERTDLERLFITPLWTGCATATRRTTPGSLILRDEKFWLPLIAVFSGLRQEEICQLHGEDIRQDEDIWYLDINERPPRKVKNATAVRRVPVHAELLRLGFLTHVEAQRHRRESRIFPDLAPGGADGRLGHAFTKWFTRYRRDVGLYRQGLDFHSFRHTATTLMHQAGVAAAVIDHITGHTTAGETARYTKRSTLTQMKAAIDTIDIRIDLTALYVQGHPAA